jgi:RNA polymerase sigma factor (sigma-70 family)
MAVAIDDTPDVAFERLYERHVTDVYRYVLAVLRNPADAEDVTQTTFMNAYRAMKRGERPEKPQNWLITIAHNACRTRYIRASRRPQEVPLEVGTNDVAVPETEKPNVRAVLQALSELPFNQRSALVMRELEGRSYDEIATALGVTVPAVEMLIFRARRSLRLQRGSLKGIIGLVPLPASLATFGGGAAVVGGTALGLAGLGKIAAVIAALAVGGAVGYEAAGVKLPHREAQVVRAVPVADDVVANAAVARSRPLVSKPAAQHPVATRPARTKVRTASPPRTTRPRPQPRPTAPTAASGSAGDPASAQAGGKANAQPRPAAAPTNAAAPKIQVQLRPATTAGGAVKQTVQKTVTQTVDQVHHTVGQATHAVGQATHVVGQATDAVSQATHVVQTVVDQVTSVPSKVTPALPPAPVVVQTPPAVTVPAVTVPAVTVPTVVPDPVGTAPVPAPAPPADPPAPPVQVSVPAVTTPTATLPVPKLP